MADTPHWAAPMRIGLARIASAMAYGRRPDPGFPPWLGAWLTTPWMRRAALALSVALVLLPVSPPGLQAGESASADARIPAPLLEVGSTIMLGGYQQDHPLVLMADTECRIVGRSTDASGLLLLRHNWTGTRGDSGAPLLIEKGGKWHTAGVDVAAELGVASGLAVVLDEARKRL
jgi:hypothetical protein